MRDADSGFQPGFAQEAAPCTRAGALVNAGCRREVAFPRSLRFWRKELHEKSRRSFDRLPEKFTNSLFRKVL